MGRFLDHFEKGKEINKQKKLHFFYTRFVWGVKSISDFFLHRALLQRLQFDIYTTFLVLKSFIKY